MSVRELRGLRGKLTPAPTRGPLPGVVPLDAPLALDATVVGRKAANLAQAAASGLPVLPGTVVTTATAADLAGGGPGRRRAVELLRPVWARLTRHGSRAVVVRSSSPGEDGDTSSMAGRFLSVLDVRGWEAFLAAVDAVVDSGATLLLEEGGERTPVPMAVLVQPQLAAATGGVLFGADPVSGRTDRLVVAAVAGGPDRLVSGAADGTRHTLSRRGRLLELTGDDGPRLPGRRRRALARLARRVAGVFGGAQDVEWAVDGDGRLWLLQSRPVTAVAARAGGPVLGPGPVAETFPDALTPLEQDLWLAPLRQATERVVVMTGARSRAQVRRSPVVVAVGGRAAVDLELLGAAEEAGGALRRLDPRPPARRLRAAWRTGRLRTALPDLGRDLVATADAELASTGPVGELSTGGLLALLRGTRQALVALHGHEMLVGLLLRPGTGTTASAAGALRALAAARAAGLGDGEIVARYPEVLALVPPAVGPLTLPDAAAVPDTLLARPVGPADEVAALREDLRLRARWVQELAARAAVELGRRLARARVLGRPHLVRWLTLAELEAAADGGELPADLHERALAPAGPPLPAAFRLTAAGAPVPVAAAVRAGARAGQGAGGGRGAGPVAVTGNGPLPRGAVLVARTLDPGLAASLPGLAGLVAETGSVLSHLAILARELGVPTVVGVASALDRFPPGARVLVDGTTGEVRLLDGDLTAPAPAAAGAPGSRAQEAGAGSRRGRGAA